MGAASVHRVTVLAGAFGAGKTTVLRSLLADERSSERITIINEIGAVSAEVAGLQIQEERATVLRDGCLCCQRREDLIDALRLYSACVPPDRGAAVLIELSGAADAAPVIHTIMNDRFLKNHYRLEELITVVDPVNLPHRGAERVMWSRQVSIADRLIVSKADLVTDERVAEVEDILASVNPLARICRGRQGVFVQSPRVRPSRERPNGRRPTDDAGAAHGELPDVTVVQLPTDVEWGRFSVWLSLLLHRWGQDVLRVKGVVAGGPGLRTSVEAVHHVVYPPRHVAAAAATNEIVFMTRGVPVVRLARSLEAFLGIQHDTG